MPLLEEAARDPYVALIEGIPTPFDEAAGRRGIAGRAVRLVCAWALSAGTGIERVRATVHLWNGASQRVLEKIGFVREVNPLLSEMAVPFPGISRDCPRDMSEAATAVPGMSEGLSPDMS